MKVHGKLKVKKSDGDKTKLTGKINIEDITQAESVITEGETSFEELNATEVRIEGTAKCTNLAAKKLSINGKIHFSTITAQQAEMSGKVSGGDIVANILSIDGRVKADRIESQEIRVHFVHDKNNIENIVCDEVQVSPSEKVTVSANTVLGAIFSKAVDIQSASPKIEIGCLKCERAMLRGECVVKTLICHSLDADDSVRILNREEGV